MFKWPPYDLKMSSLGAFDGDFGTRKGPFGGHMRTSGGGQRAPKVVFDSSDQGFCWSFGGQMETKMGSNMDLKAFTNRF